MMDNFNIPIKQENEGELHQCQFCSFCVSGFEEYKLHTFGHFTRKSCSVCNVRLVQICDEWFELHTASNCENNNHIHTFNENEHDPHNADIIKMEIPTALEHYNPSNTTVELQDFGEIFVANLNTLDEVNDGINFPQTTSGQLETPDTEKPLFHETEANSIDHLPSKSIVCRFCNKKFSSRFRLDCHVQSYHDNTNQKKCKHCRQSFQSFHELDRHLRKCSWNNRKRNYFRSHPHRPIDNFICDICGKTLKSYRNISDHMNEVHSNKNSFECRVCGRLYPNRYYLSKHLLRHKQVFDNTETSTTAVDDLDADLVERKKYKRHHPHRPKMNFSCDICGKHIMRFENLEEHMSSNHSARDNFACRICGRVYPNRYYLSKHTRRHKEVAENRKDVEMGDLDKDLMKRRKYNTKFRENRTDLTCNLCGKEFKSYYSMLEHKDSRHSISNNFQCRKCNRFYPNRYYLSKHMKRHEEAEQNGISADQLDKYLNDDLMERNRYVRSHTKQPGDSHDCEECGATFKKFYLLTEHKRAKHDEGYRCRRCGRNYPNRYYLQKHMKQNENCARMVFENEDEHRGHEQSNRQYLHQSKTDYACELCSMAYTTIECLQEHMIANHARKENILLGQIKRTTNKANIDEFEKIDEDLIERNRYHRSHPHRPVSNFTCDICDKVLANYYSIKEHMKLKHSRESKITPKCKICGRTFTTKRFLEKHEQLVHAKPLPKTHKPAKPTKIFQTHMCSVCGRIFPDKSKMLSHEKTHQGIKASCELCGKQFMHKNYLRKHYKGVHAGERPFACNIDGCEWTFAYPQCLQRHQARRHGMVKNRNACPICSKEFPDSTYHLKRHLKAHANNTAKEYIPEQKSVQTK